MHAFAERFYSLFVVAAIFSTLFVNGVLADSNVIKLPSDQLENGACPRNFDPSLCPVKCFRPDPVCGIDGVTYWCGCADAYCAGARVKSLGFCEVGSGESGTAGQALLLIHMVWLIFLGVFVLFGLL